MHFQNFQKYAVVVLWSAIGLFPFIALGGCRLDRGTCCNLSCDSCASVVRVNEDAASVALSKDELDAISRSTSSGPGSESNDPTIKQVGYVEPEQGGFIKADEATAEAIDRYPLDLAIVMQLAGADNWSVRIAREKVCEAAARLELAEVAILPSLNLGVIYNVHDGEIQQTDGNIITASRNSLFVGGGAGIANTPLNGGSGGPSRLVVDFSLADAMFKPLAARRRVDAAKSNRCRVLNDTLLEATLAYYELVRAQSLTAIAVANLKEAIDAADLTNSFVSSGKGSQADVHRVNIVVNSRRQALIRAKTAIEVASARLAEVLQLDPCEADPEIGLYAVEMHPLAIQIIDWSTDLNSFVDMAQSSRCEITQAFAETLALDADREAELWRAVLPNLYLGYSGGLFGGGTGGGLTGLDWRNDFDIGVTWQIKNLGLGNSASQDLAGSRYRQQLFETRKIRDKVSQQVSTTYHSARQHKQEMELLAENVQQAKQALSKNIDAIRGLEGLPLEAIQSLNSVAQSRSEYLNSVINYNQWQLRLMRATGQPFGETGCGTGSCNCCNLCDKCTSLPSFESCDCTTCDEGCRLR